MPERTLLQDKLVECLQEAHAMEGTSLALLESLIDQTDDPDLQGILHHHKGETERHQALIKERLGAHGADSAAVKDLTAAGGAFVKTLFDRVRDAKPARNARDGYVTESVEIASYELLGRIAERAGDQKTAEVARTICREERAMADKLDHNWDRITELTLQAEGVAPSREPAGAY